MWASGRSWGFGFPLSAPWHLPQIAVKLAWAFFLLAKMPWKISKISACCGFWFVLGFGFSFTWLYAFGSLSHLLSVWLRRSFCLSRQGFSAVYYRLTRFISFFKVKRLFTLCRYCLFDFQVAVSFLSSERFRPSDRLTLWPSAAVSVWPVDCQSVFNSVPCWLSLCLSLSVL